MFRKFLQLFAIICFFTPSSAQQRTNWKEAYAKYKHKSRADKILSPYSLTIRGGLTQFYGELNQQDMQGMLGIGLNRDLNKKLALSLDYSTGKLGGEREEFFHAYFINEYKAIDLLVKWNLMEQFTPEAENEFQIKLYGGIGLMLFRANAFDIATNNLLRSFYKQRYQQTKQTFSSLGQTSWKSRHKKHP